MNIEKAKEIHSSMNWAEIVKEISENKIQPLLNRLKSCTKDDLEIVQTRIKVWEEAQRLPQDVIEREE
jgi:hypothetical protein